MIQLFGSCFGQLGSTLNCGPSASASDVAKANPKKNTDAASLERCDIDIRFPEFCGGEFLHTGEFLAWLARCLAHISGLRRVDSNGVMPRASNYFACVRLPEREPSCPEMC